MNFTRLIAELENSIHENKDKYENVNNIYLKRHKKRYVHTINLLQRINNKGKVLELGSFPHHMMFLLTKLGYNATSIDLDTKRMSKFIKANKLKVIECDIEQEKWPLKDNSIDVILFNEIFEHLANPIHALLEANRVLKKEGTMMLTTPNLYYFPRIMLYLTGKGAMSEAFYEFSRKYKIGSMGHFREYTTREIKNFLDNTNFVVRKILYARYEPTRLKAHGILNIPIDIITNIFPHLKPHQIFIAGKGKTLQAHVLKNLSDIRKITL